MHSKIEPLPKTGDIVWLQPSEEWGVDTPKRRPGVVLGVSKLRHEIIVAFGTSQKTQTLPIRVSYSKS